MPNGNNHDEKPGSESSTSQNDEEIIETPEELPPSQDDDSDALEREYQEALRKEAEAREGKKEETEENGEEDGEGEPQEKPQSRASERIRELVRKNKEREAEIERLKAELEGGKKVKEPDYEEEEESSDKVKDQIKQELIEESFLEKIGVENSYDSQVIIKGLKPIALSLLKTGKAKTYKEALGKAYVFDNMEEEINRRAVGKPSITAGGLHGAGGSLGISSQPQSYTREDVAGARRLGMSLKEYLSFKA